METKDLMIGFRIEYKSEVRWCRDAISAIANLEGIIKDNKIEISVHPDSNRCFMRKLITETIVSCIYNCLNCEERRNRKEV